jgi:polyhydroxyalkanoate synthase
MWSEFHAQDTLPEPPTPFLADPAQWMGLMQAWYRQIPLLDPARQQQLWEEGTELWQAILEQYGIGPDGEMTSDAPKAEPDLPRQDRRFADPAWREQPVFALIHQTYLLLAERLGEMVDDVEGVSDEERAQLRFALKSVLDAMSPANFPLTNPVVLERTLETHGANLIRGIERLTADLEKGQLTHADASAFKLGENIACTPGKVVHETPLYQLIQYSPATDQVLEVPLVIFPPWINRFYILDLNPKKSFVKWAVDQGLTVFMVSWRSADASMADVTWDDYVRAQIDAIDVIRERLGVPSASSASGSTSLLSR